MKVVFRADASLAIGSGHVMRCLTLAEVLRAQGAMVSFICREHDGHLCDLIENRGITVVRLQKFMAGYHVADSGLYAASLGASWQDDASQSLAAVMAMPVAPSWLVVDHYAIDHRWERSFRDSVDRIMVIDDLADRQHDCDLLLDQNLVAQRETRYADKVPTSCGLLLGPENALLQPIYGELHVRIPPREGPLRRILIFFSGADTENLTGLALTAVLRLGRPEIMVDVVISASTPHTETVSRLAANQPNVHLHHRLPTLAPLMAAADLAIGAAGATSWERLCLGLPALVVTLAENQRPIASELQKRGLIRWLGHYNEVTEETIKTALENLLQDGLPSHWSSRCSAVIDGKGVARVCAALTAEPGTPLIARYATPADQGLVLAWETSRASAGTAYTPVVDSIEGQCMAFRKHLRDLDNCHWYILETQDAAAIGQVRFRRERTIWEIDCKQAPVFYGRNLGRSMISKAVSKLRVEIAGELTFRDLTEPPEDSSPHACLAKETRSSTNSRRLSIAVCTDEASWINGAIPDLLVRWLVAGHQVTWSHDAASVPACDICFYLSYGRIVSAAILARHGNNLIVHESDLPKGRGWSPLTWQVLEGAETICVTLFEAVGKVDAGEIYLQESIQLRGDELVDDLRRKQTLATFSLCQSFVSDYPSILQRARKQLGEPSFYPRRGPPDGRLDLDQPLKAQINLLRVSDNNRYPAWFEVGGTKYQLHVRKAE